MPDMRPSLHMEEEVGSLLGGSALLLGTLPAQQTYQTLRSSRRRIHIRRPLTVRTVPYTAVQVTRLSRFIVSSTETSPSPSHSFFGNAWFICGAPKFHSWSSSLSRMFDSNGDSIPASR
jgi:hypothetical protein